MKDPRRVLVTGAGGVRDGQAGIFLSYGVRSGRYLTGRVAETVIGSLRELPEVISAAERSGGPADVEQGLSLRNVHKHARF